MEENNTSFNNKTDIRNKITEVNYNIRKSKLNADKIYEELFSTVKDAKKFKNVLREVFLGDYGFDDTYLKRNVLLRNFAIFGLMPLILLIGASNGLALGTLLAPLVVEVYAIFQILKPVFDNKEYLPSFLNVELGNIIEILEENRNNELKKIKEMNEIVAELTRLYKTYDEVQEISVEESMEEVVISEIQVQDEIKVRKLTKK